MSRWLCWEELPAGVSPTTQDYSLQLNYNHWEVYSSGMKQYTHFKTWNLLSHTLHITPAVNVSLFHFYCPVHPCIPWKEILLGFLKVTTLTLMQSHHLSLRSQPPTCHALQKWLVHLDPSPLHPQVWIYCNSPLAPPSREPRGPVASSIGKWENKRKCIPDRCGQECAFTALRQAGNGLASCLHPTAEGVCISGSLTLRKLQTARGRDHSCSEASTITLWVSPFPTVFTERKYRI